MNTVPRDQAIAVLREALQFFIDRCDSGMAQSKTTYAKFKETLAATEGAAIQPAGDAVAEVQGSGVRWLTGSGNLPYGTKLYAAPREAKAEQAACICVAFSRDDCPRCATPATPEANSEASDLPKLPPMDHIADIPGVCRVVAYSANAMSAYGKLCRDTRQPVAAPSDLIAACRNLIGHCDKNAPMGDSLYCVQEIRAALKSAAPVAPAQAVTDWLLPDDLAALERFHECCMDFDSGGHDVSKPKMSRLVEIGVVRNSGFGRHMVTTFGDYVLRRDEVVSRDLPLKTYAEYCEDSRIESERAILAKRTGSAEL